MIDDKNGDHGLLYGNKNICKKCFSNQPRECVFFSKNIMMADINVIEKLPVFH